MKKPIGACLVIFIVLMLTASLSAQIYKYIDETGQKRWTDDLSQVPVNQRESVEQFEDVGEISQEAAPNQEENQTTATPKSEQPENEIELTRESLRQEKSDLENQYQSLLEERKRLTQMKSEKGDIAHRTELNHRISAYNAKTKQYELQLKAYKERIDAYKKKTMTTRDTSTP